MNRLFLVLAVLVMATAANAQQLKLPALSPTARVSQDFSTSTIDIEYSRPSMRGREIFGGLVPYGEVWRTGANQSTKITFGEEVMIGGSTIPAGSYSFYTVPGKDSWTIILNKNTGNWGAFGYDKKDDVARFSVVPTQMPKNVETFTMYFDEFTMNSCTINMMWERTHVSVLVTAENNDRIVKSIEKAVETPSIPYRQAALYYVSTDQKLDKALEYTEKAIAQNTKAYWNVMLKAEICAKLGKKDEARAAVATVRELVKGTESEASYQSSTQALLDSLN